MLLVISQEHPFYSYKYDYSECMFTCQDKILPATDFIFDGWYFLTYYCPNCNNKSNHSNYKHKRIIQITLVHFFNGIMKYEQN